MSLAKQIADSLNFSKHGTETKYSTVDTAQQQSHRAQQPLITATFQIRLGGDKGKLVFDRFIYPDQIHFRPSMFKCANFHGTICSVKTSPLHLNCDNSLLEELSYRSRDWDPYVEI